MSEEMNHRDARRLERVGNRQRDALTRGALIHAFADGYDRDELGRMFDQTAEPSFPVGPQWTLIADALGEAWASHPLVRGLVHGAECPVGVHDSQGRCSA